MHEHKKMSVPENNSFKRYRIFQNDPYMTWQQYFVTSLNKIQSNGGHPKMAAIQKWRPPAFREPTLQFKYRLKNYLFLHYFRQQLVVIIFPRFRTKTPNIK